MKYFFKLSYDFYLKKHTYIQEKNIQSVPGIQLAGCLKHPTVFSHSDAKLKKN